MTNGVASAHKENVTDARGMTESDGIVVMENRKFTNTVLPVFSGAEGWYQHIHIVQAIAKSNGWPDETAALQLFVHLTGEALNVALLLTKEERESWTGLVDGLAAYYQSPGRLAGLRRRFESVFRQPGLDPATFATDLGMLAIQGFGDMKEQARDTPRPTSEERQTQPPHTDNDLDRSLAKTGLSEMETPRDSIKCKIATIGTACPIKIGKPVAMADVAEPRGLAGTGASGPVVAGTWFTAVADMTGASGPRRSETGEPVVTGI